jgi:hypothetical protein
MNEQILDLAVKSGHIVGELPLNVNEKIQLAGLEKFAELLILKCAHLVGGYTKENEFGTDVKEAYEEITKHFGVE